jgi:ABC-type lipoprotein export system ATPase subunit
VIEFHHVTKTFGHGQTTVTAVNDVSFQLSPGTFWALMGPSGSGKSTILHLIAGLTPPTSGSVLVDGTDVARLDARESAILRRRRIGYVLQSLNLLPFLTAAENVAMPLILDKVEHGEINRRTRDALDAVGMSHRSAHKPGELSGGEQQRVAIARALVIEPAIVLADEPTGSLDRTNGMRVLELIADLNRRAGLSVLMVTHDADIAGFASHTWHLVDGVLESSSESTSSTTGVRDADTPADGTPVTPRVLSE